MAQSTPSFPNPSPPVGAELANCVERARIIGPSIDQHADEIELTRRFPEPLLTELHESRLLRMFLPRSVGGDEAHPHHYLDAITELGRHDGSLAWNVFVANSSALIAAFLELDIAREIYADPRSLIAWGPPAKPRASAASGGYLVSGQWVFASGCRQAKWMGAHCLVTEPDGSLRLNAYGHPGIRTLLFPAHQAELIDNWNPIGLRGTASDGYRVTDLFVSERFSSTREEPDNRREAGPLYAFTQQGLYAVGVAGVALGLASAMLDEFKSLAQRKTPRGLARHATSPTIQAEVARATAKLGAGRAWLGETLDETYSSATDVSSIDIPTRAAVRLACTNAIHHALEVAVTSYRLAGVDAIFPGSPFERRFRDINTLSQQIQSRPAHFEAVGQVLLGEAPEVFY